MRILVVEDDVQIADMLAEALTNREYTVDVVQDGEAALNYVEILDYSLIVLDITLPKLDGIKFCQILRSRNLPIPILMLTARDTIADKIIGLDAGADDYMVKPFDLGELMARVRALSRRGNSRPGINLSWGNLCINQSTYEVFYEEQLLNLTPKEYSILELLVSSGRRVLSRPGIIQQVWSMEDSPTEDTVKSHIKSLRQKLREVGAPDEFIETVHGLGYRLKQL
ncbi:two component transcriptional regulator [Calothrix sp. NIES-4071]|nr:two component transcriptional regulator [Calothrix sp. NIES-4071]BAZ55217.1 two component transcriptional regulator [Calothrix sp. NIES-4105]